MFCKMYSYVILKRTHHKIILEQLCIREHVFQHCHCVSVLAGVLKICLCYLRNNIAKMLKAAYICHRYLYIIDTGMVQLFYQVYLAFVLYLFSTWGS